LKSFERSALSKASRGLRTCEKGIIEKNWGRGLKRKVARERKRYQIVPKGDRKRDA